MKKAAAILLLFALVFSVAACSPLKRTALGFSMGSDYCVKYIADSDLDAEIEQELSSIEESFSVRVESSVLARINAARKGEKISLTAEEAVLLSEVFALSEQTSGAFCPAVLPLVKAWGFDPPYRMNGEVPPSAEAITDAKALSSLSLFDLNADAYVIVKGSDGASLDLGAALKGYAAGAVASRLRKEGVSEALVYLGGTIAAVGRDYVIGVTPPRDSKEIYAFRFSLADGEICATSGDYERYYLYDGTRYHHILNAETGYPANSGVISATVVSSSGLVADAFATAVVVLGAEKGAQLLRNCGVKGALVTEERKVITVGLDVTIKDQSYEIA